MPDPLACQYSETLESWDKGQPGLVPQRRGPLGHPDGGSLGFPGSRPPGFPGGGPLGFPGNAPWLSWWWPLGFPGRGPPGKSGPPGSQGRGLPGPP